MEDDEYDFKKIYNKGDVIHYLRVMPNLGINEIVECKLRTIEHEYMVATIEKTKQTIYINYGSINFAFNDRKLAAIESKKYHVRKVTKEINDDEE
jgi:hypothetical protein